MRRIWLILLCLPAFCQDPREMLERVFRALGDPGGRVLHIRDVDGVEQDYQSVPPFITVFNLHESWTYLGTGAELVDTDTVSPGSPRQNRGMEVHRSDGTFPVSTSSIVRSSSVPGLPGG